MASLTSESFLGDGSVSWYEDLYIYTETSSQIVSSECEQLMAQIRWEQNVPVNCFERERTPNYVPIVGWVDVEFIAIFTEEILKKQ